MKTTHSIYTGAAQSMSKVGDNSVELIVTSPPYPMIEMWDEILSEQNPNIANALHAGCPDSAFELMHGELDRVWDEINRVLIPGGIACINIGDATRTINGNFALYSNHARIISYLTSHGFINLPNIIWRKQTNAPNKFMGSGMLPAGAYVTLEHEWILIFRKGGKREFKSATDKQKRRESSFFWEERNVWFSDLWDNIKGTRQKIAAESRDRSAAYPLEIPYRLINMYSLQGDTVLDPFLGTGTTTIAAIMSNRNSVGYEIDNQLANVIADNIQSSSIEQMNEVIKNRIEAHKIFIAERQQSNKEVKHFNKHLQLPVMTSQETDMQFVYLSDVSGDNNRITAKYSETAPMSLNIKIGSRKRISPTPKGDQIVLTF
jgi:DNA modification methylase